MAISIHVLVNLVIKICIVSTCLFKLIESTNPPPKFSAILVFGDSLVDTGNNNFINTFAKANHVPYGMSLPNRVPTGRFSNGKLMSDLLASALGIKDLVPPFLDPNLPADELKTGVCFASAGSGYDDMTGAMYNVIPVSKQVNENFKQYVEKLKSSVGEEQANQTLSNALVFFVAGSNDYLINSKRTQPGYEDYLHNQIQKYTKALYDSGCRNFMVAGIPPLGESMIYNQKLSQLLPRIQGTLLGSKFMYADIAKSFIELTTNPQRYGIIVPNVPCCEGGCNVGSVACPNPNQYFLWDSVHPTEAAYKVMTQSLLQNLLSQI